MSDDSLLCLGAPSTNVIFEIRRRNPEIAAFHFVFYARQVSLEQRLGPAAAPALLEILQTARERRGDSNVHGKTPYWGSILSVDMGVPELDFFLGHALADHSNERQVAIDAADLSPATIGSLAGMASDEEQVGLSSSCRLRDGTMAHIPMLDFRLPPHATAVNRVRRVLGALQQKETVIAASGRSFHSWGMELVRPEVFRDFLARALLLSPLIDERFIARSLLRDHSALRILPSAQKPFQPQIVGLHQVSEVGGPETTERVR